jgi:16S rRNA G966 N2-methylase RsmD
MFPSGTRTIFEAALRESVQVANIIHADDSAIRFATKGRLNSAAQLPFANNVFHVLTAASRTNLNRSLRQIIGGIDSIQFPIPKGSPPGFRTMIHIDGALTPIDAGLRDEINDTIAAATGLRLESRGSGLEFWIIGRKSMQDLVFAQRLPKRQERQAEKGALSPQLATMLVLASGPRAEDRFLDPFSGSGAIVAARLHYPVSSAIASDVRPALSAQNNRAFRRDRRVTIAKEDARQLASIPDGQVDVIVTDPPWGEFRDDIADYERFAHQVAASFNRVLNPERGRLVVLVSRRRSDLFVSALRAQEFRIHAKHGILVNGHPASVIVTSR